MYYVPDMALYGNKQCYLKIVRQFKLILIKKNSNTYKYFTFNKHCIVNISIFSKFVLN